MLKTPPVPTPTTQNTAKMSGMLEAGDSTRPACGRAGHAQQNRRGGTSWFTAAPVDTKSQGMALWGLNPGFSLLIADCLMTAGCFMPPRRKLLKIHKASFPRHCTAAHIFFSHGQIPNLNRNKVYIYFNLPGFFFSQDVLYIHTASPSQNTPNVFTNTLQINLLVCIQCLNSNGTVGLH